MIAPWLILLLSSRLLEGGGALEVNDSNPVEHVLIRRCCRPGYDLEDPRDSAATRFRCVPSPDSEFRPEIYSPEHEEFLAEPPAHWQILENTRPACVEPHELRYVARNQLNPFIVFADGSARIEISSDDALSPEDYCLGSRTLLACLPRRNDSLQAAATMRQKIRKCCGEMAVYNIERNACVETSGKASLEDEQILLLGSNENNGKVAAFMEMISGSPKSGCDGNLTIIGEARFSELQSDGSIIVAKHNIPAEEFCIERVQAKDSADLLPVKVFACLEYANRVSGVPVRDIRFTLYPVGFIISAVFLAATLATSWLLPASHHVLHWRCQTHHVACLMLGDIAMAIIQLGGTSLQGEFCRILGESFSNNSSFL
ncbi:hypothetical protein TKK_0003579 [Trichogramma kaykai]|uniref:G-protein coupled receptor Mth-like 1 n=1 Tax=Trichogramma kaykai TaxID=54128 RepID=A0ABD2XPP5_9HYME